VLTAAVVLGTVSATLLAGAVTASAATPSQNGPDIASVSSALHRSGALNDEASATATSVSDPVMASHGAGSVSIPNDAAEGIRVTSNAQTVIIGIPGRGTRNAHRIDRATVSYSGLGSAATISAEATATGARELITIAGATAPKTYDFQMTLPVDTDLVANNAGGYNVVQGTHGASLNLGSIPAPWAKDAAGKPVPTHYNVVGQTLVQTVDFSATTSFPVVADPSYIVEWNCGYVTCTIYLGKYLTATIRNHIATGAGAAAVIGIACNIFPVPWRYVCQAGIAIRYANFADSINNGARTNACAALKWIEVRELGSILSQSQAAQFLAVSSAYWYSVGGTYCPA
jgi:hypothetical protein